MRRARKIRATTLPLLPSLQVVPPPLAQRESGKVAKATWTDPDDLNPNRRVARRITGWRRFCPLRKVLHCNGAAAWCTVEHVIAADLLRRWHDTARIGLTAARDLDMPINQVRYGPKSGPSVLELQRTACWRSFGRAWAIFDAREKSLIRWTVLENRSLEAWELETGASKSTAVRAMRPAMNKLVEHLKSEVDEAMNKGETDLAWGA